MGYSKTKQTTVYRAFSRTEQVVIEGELSYSADVKSGVPQSSVLGHVYSFFYINDLPDKIQSSTIRMFADGTIAYLTVTGKENSKALQDDLDILAEWEDTSV